MPHIPDHELLRQIGRGSYGEVWLARNVMGAGRAVKLVRRASFDSDRPFEREFAAVRRYEPASRMADGLVNVLHVGRCDADGLFYYVMELADDAAAPQAEGTDAPNTEAYVPLTLRWMLESRRRLPLSDCLTIAQNLAQAVASLHRAGLTHRDIKPSNIIFVNGRAKLADIGLVGDLGESRSVVGTEGYIPPEGPGHPGADLFALGMVLYEMVTGLPPGEYPRVPSEWMDARRSDELEFVEVVLHATEPDATRRYQSAGEMLADLALMESGKSVRRVHLLERRWKALKRTAVLGLALAMLLGGGLWLWHRAELRGQRADAAEALTLQARADERVQRFLALREHAARLIRSELAGWRRGALQDIDEAARINPADTDLRNTLITALSRTDLTPLRRWTQPGGETGGPVLSDDQSLIAIAEADGTLRIERTADGTVVQHLRHWLRSIQPSFDCRFTPGGRFFGVRFSGLRTLRPVLDKTFPYESFTWFRISDGKIVLELPSHIDCHDGILRDGSHLLACDRSARQLIRYNLETGKEISRVAVDTSVEHFLLSPDETRAAIQPAKGPYQDELLIADTATGQITARWTGVPSMLGAMAWTPDSAQVILGCSASPFGVHLLRAADASAPAERLVLHSAEVVDAAVSPDGAFLLTSSWDQTTMLTDLVLRRTTAILPGWSHSGSLGFSPDGRTCWRRIVQSGTSTALELSAVEPPIVSLIPMPSTVNACSFSPDGAWLGIAWRDGLTVHHLETRRSHRVAGPHAPLSAASCCFTQDTRGLLLAAGTQKGLQIIRQEHPEPASPWHAGPSLSPGQINVVTTAGPGRIVAWGGSHPGVQWAGERTTPWPGQRSVVSAAASADGQHLVYSRGGGDTLYLKQSSGEAAGEIPGVPIPWVGISADGTRLSACSLSAIHCWDTATRQPLWQYPKDFPFIRGAPLHTPDGRFLIARTGLHPALIDARTGTLHAILAPALPAHTTSAAISPDGHRLALCGRSFLLLWDLQTLDSELRRRGMN